MPSVTAAVERPTGGCFGFAKPEDESRKREAEAVAEIAKFAMGKSINLITTEGSGELLPVSKSDLVWVMVPVAVDSGCCKHVTP